MQGRVGVGVGGGRGARGRGGSRRRAEEDAAAGGALRSLVPLQHLLQHLQQAGELTDDKLSLPSPCPLPLFSCVALCRARGWTAGLPSSDRALVNPLAQIGNRTYVPRTDPSLSLHLCNSDDGMDIAFAIFRSCLSYAVC